MSIDVTAIRNQFRFFRDHPNTIYFDNAATTQKPDSVVDAMDACWRCSSNIGRSSYSIASRLTKQVEQVREQTASFINAHDAHEIVFTAGATHSLNLVALSWGLPNLRDGDEILYCPHDHKSNVLPWFHLKELLKKQDVHIKLVPYEITNAGCADIDDILAKVTPHTRLITLTHLHNVYGVRNDIEELRPKLRDDILLSLDAAQSAGHIPLDVQELNVDFLSFSGHKMFAATGCGVLWVAHKLHNQLSPVFTGGGDLTINEEGSMTSCAMPSLLESGTPNVAGILSLGAAMKFTQEIGLNAIHERLQHLTQACIAKLRTHPKIRFIHGPAHCRCAIGYGTVTFALDDVPSQDIGFLLDQHNIYVRTGEHCRTKAVAENEGVRISMHIYNTEEEIERCVEALREY